MDDKPPEPLSPEAVQAICTHLNEDHAEDCALLCRTHGVPDAQHARAVGLDTTGLDLVAVVDGQEHPVRVPWSHPLRERREVREQLVELVEKARS